MGAARIAVPVSERLPSRSDYAQQQCDARKALRPKVAKERLSNDPIVFGAPSCSMQPADADALRVLWAEASVFQTTGDS